jgi:L-fuconolactonase
LTRIDAHQHFWRLGDRRYTWLNSAEHGPICRDFEPPELEPLIRAAGIDRTVVVQAENSFADTDAMLAHADRYPWIGSVVGWVPLLEPAEAERALDRYGQHRTFRGVRHLVHDEPDPDWLRRKPVAESLAALAYRDLVFEVPAVFPRHLEHIPLLASEHPGLRIVIDHLGKPPIARGELEPWATQLAAAAALPNVYAKVSGLNTVADPVNWSAEDLRPFIEVALACFGPERLLFGSDWPVCLLAGDYARVWQETLRALDGQSASVCDAVLGGTAAELYGLAQ